MLSRRDEVLQTLRTPKWIALTLLVLVLSVAFAVLSSWQYQRAMDQVTAQRAAAATPEPIAELVPGEDLVPNDSLGRAALVAGQYTAHAWVPGRAAPDGRPGVWLVSGVDDGSGLLTAVLRGWLPQRSEEPTQAEQVVEVAGRVSSPENFYASVGAAAPDEVVSITDDSLQQVWQQPTRAGYVVLSEQDPALPGDPEPVPPVFGVDDGVGFPFQNVGYALQWLVFIAFAAFMYYRWFSDDLAALRAMDGEAVAGDEVSRSAGADLP